MAKSMREVMGDEPYSDEGGEAEPVDDTGEAEAELIAELGSALGLEEEAARRVYDVICAVVESKADSDMPEHGPSPGKKGKPAVAIVLGR